MTRQQAGSALSANSCRYPVHDRAFPHAGRPVLVVDATIEAPRDIGCYDRDAYDGIVAYHGARSTQLRGQSRWVSGWTPEVTDQSEATTTSSHSAHEAQEVAREIVDTWPTDGPLDG